MPKLAYAYLVCVRLSVSRLKNSDIVSKRLNISSKFLDRAAVHHPIASQSQRR